MMEARLKSGLWVSALVRQCDRLACTAVVLRKGDPDSGGIVVVLRGRAGLSALSQVRDGEGRLGWMRATGPGPVDQEAADAYVARALKRDPDLWVVEVDAPGLMPPFEARLV